VVLSENAKDFLHGQENKQTSPDPSQSKQISLKNNEKAEISIFGHIIRSQQLQHLAICGKICGKNARGRPRKMYLDQLKEQLNLNTLRILQLPC